MLVFRLFLGVFVNLHSKTPLFNGFFAVVDAAKSNAGGRWVVWRMQH